MYSPSQLTTREAVKATSRLFRKCDFKSIRIFTEIKLCIGGICFQSCKGISNIHFTNNSKINLWLYHEVRLTANMNILLRHHNSSILIKIHIQQPTIPCGRRNIFDNNGIVWIFRDSSLCGKSEVENNKALINLGLIV